MNINTKDDLQNFLTSNHFNIPEIVTFADNLLAEYPGSELSDIATSLYTKVKLGFDCKNTFSDEGNRKARLTTQEFWQLLSSSGFTDREENFDEWRKPYNLIDHRINYDWLSPIKQNGIQVANRHRIYHDVLATEPHVLEDILNNLDITTIIEPMASGAEMCYYGSYTYPYVKFFASDIDPECKTYFDSLPRSNHDNLIYETANIFSENYWNTIIERTRLESCLAFIGKQSICYFNYDRIRQLLHSILGRKAVRYLYLEMPDPYYPEELDSVDDLTPVVCTHAGLEIYLKNATTSINPLNLWVDFNLEIGEKSTQKTQRLTNYPWYLYTPSHIIHLANMLGYQAQVLDPVNNEFRYTQGLTHKSIEDWDHTALLLFK